MFDLTKFDLLRYVRPRPKSEWEKRYGTFNRRLFAATLDAAIAVMTFVPLVGYLVRSQYGPPTVTAADIQGFAIGATGFLDAIRLIAEGLATSGHTEYMANEMRWQFYGFALYSVVFWHFLGATPGKFICGLKIVDAKTGGNMGDLQSLLRIACYIPSAFCFGLGFFWIAFTKKRKGWHDIFAGTEVVRVARWRKGDDR